MRIGAGAWRGRSLAVPPGIRPSGARLREALFARWAGRTAGARVLDLFAGSGAVGLEALSRGAELAVLVEADRRVVAVLRRNASLAGERAVVVRATVPEQLDRLPPGPFELIFADPPYGIAEPAALPAALARLLAAGGELAIEHSRRVELPAAAAPLERTARRRYGDSALSFYGYSARK